METLKGVVFILIVTGAIVLAGVVIVGIVADNFSTQTSSTPVAKIVKEKYIDRSSCYIVAEDGTYIRTVDRKLFFSGNIGDAVSSCYWRDR